MDTNKCYIYTFCPARWKESWAQKMQDHSLTKISNEMMSQLGIGFQKSVRVCFYCCWANFHWTQLEKKAIYRIRGTFSSASCTALCHTLSACPFWIWQTVLASGSHRGWLYPQQLVCCYLVSNNNKNHSIETYWLFQYCKFILLSLPALLSCNFGPFQYFWTS